MELAGVSSLCLDCGVAANQSPRCPGCGCRRIIRHPELHDLALAHVDCDAFYASIEKRDNPSIADLPVIVGGGVRGVVTTACYVARTFGVRSAMPMFKALKACPDAVVIKPNFAKYSAASREMRSLMAMLTPLVEPVSIDEAFLDLSGTRRALRMSPAAALAKLQRDIKQEIGISVSIGLSVNKFLAKIASDFDKPNGFSVIGAAEAPQVLAALPVTAILGVGAVFAKRLRADGVETIGDLQQIERMALAARYGEHGIRLAELSFGRDTRRVSPKRDTKSVSTETTFAEDMADLKELESILWRLCERTSARMKEKRLAGHVVTLKLKTKDFQTITRRTKIQAPSNLARTAFDAARPMLASSIKDRAFRLIGVGYSELSPATSVEPSATLFDDGGKLRREEAAIDAVRRKFGDSAIALGRTFARKGRQGRTTEKDGESND